MSGSWRCERTPKTRRSRYWPYTAAGGGRAAGNPQLYTDHRRHGTDGRVAVHVAKIAQLRYPDRALPEEVHGCFADMAKVAIALGDSAKQVLVSRDPQKAARLREQDVEMDDLYRRLFSVLMDREWKHNAIDAAETALLGRFYERFANHAVEVGRHVIFMVTGVLPSEEKISTF
jgi:phosphate transport system protein